MGKDYNLEYEYLERRKRGHRKLGLESDLISKTVISNLISKMFTSMADTQFRLPLLGTWVSNLQMQNGLVTPSKTVATGIECVESS